jgi:hypothetical protein
MVAKRCVKSISAIEWVGFFHPPPSPKFLLKKTHVIDPKMKMLAGRSVTGYSRVGLTASRAKAWVWIGVGVATRVKL